MTGTKGYNKVPGKSLFTERNRKLLTDPVLRQNPVTMNMIGICSALVITTQVNLAIVMGISIVLVAGLGSLLLSLLRFSIPLGFRMMTLFFVSAVIVIFIDWYLKYFWLEISHQLGVFIGLLVVNCIILNRYDIYALSNRPWPSLLNGIGNGIGYALILFLVGSIREIFGSGTLLGYSLFGDQSGNTESGLYDFGYENNELFLSSPFALIITGFLIWGHRYFFKTDFKY